MTAYRIANLDLLAERLPDSFGSFAVGEQPKDDGSTVRLTSLETDAFGAAAGDLLHHAGFSAGRLPDGRWLYEAPGRVPVRLAAARDYGRLELFAPMDAESRDERVTALLRVALECRIALTGGLTLHAACVELAGEAVAFSGASGVGKSTRAKKWVDALDAVWISGDRPAIDVKNGLASGVPWDGKEQIFRPVSLPLKAVLSVHRAPFTRLRRLSRAQAQRFLLRQSFIPMWDTAAAAAAMENVQRLIDQTPVYRLLCGTDGEAAEQTRSVLYDHPERICEEAEDMRIREGFVLRNVAGEHMVMPTGNNVARFDGAVVLNDVSAFIYEQLQNPVSGDDLLELVLSEFDVGRETAKRDLDELLNTFDGYGMLDRQA